MNSQPQNQSDSKNKNIYLAVMAAILILAFGLVAFVIYKSQKTLPKNSTTPIVKKPNQKPGDSSQTGSGSEQGAPAETLSDQTVSAQILDLDRQKNLLAARMPEGHIKEITLDESISYLSGLENQSNPQTITLAEFKNIVSQNISTEQQPTNSANAEIALQINFKTFKTLTNEEIPASDISSITVMPVNYELTEEDRQQLEAQIKNLQGMLEKSGSGQ